MPNTLHLLLLEDRPDDAELMVYELRKAGFELDWQRVDTETEYLMCLQPGLDAILSDYNLPQFNGLQALQHLKDKGLDIPFIVVTGSLGDEAAVEIMRQGAADYLLKDRLARLGQAVTRAIQEKGLREAQQQSEALYRAIVEDQTELVVRASPDGVLTFVNQAYCRCFGKTPAELLGHSFYPLLQAQDRAVVQAQINTLSLDNLVVMVEQEVITAGGAIRWQEWTNRAIFDEQAHLTEIQAVGRDITARKQAEAALQASETRFRLVAEATSDALYDWDMQTNVVWRSEGYTRLFGLTESISRNLDWWLERIHPDDRAFVQSHLQSIRTSPVEGWSLEYRVRRANDEYAYVVDRCRIVRDTQGAALRMVGALSDVTQRRMAEEALRRSEANEREQRVLAEALRDTVTALTSTLDPETVMSRILESLDRVVPYEVACILLTEGDHARVTYCRGLSPEEEAAFRTVRLPLDTPYLHEMMITRHPFIAADVARYSDWLPVTPALRSYMGIPIQVRQQVMGFLSVYSSQPAFYTPRYVERFSLFADQAAIAIENAQLYDELWRYANTLEQRVVERTAELKRTKDHVETILNNSSDGIILANRAMGIQQTNPAFNALFACESDDYFQAPLTGLIAAVDRQRVQQAIENTVNSQISERLEVTALRRDGTTFAADLGLSPVPNSSNLPDQVVCLWHDITERKRLEADLRQMLEKEKELNELKTRFVSIVSHEFRTPLASIQMAADILNRYSDRMTDTQRAHRLESIQTEVRHMAAMLEDVLTISRAEAGRLAFNPAPLDIQAFCQNLLSTMQALSSTHHFAFMVAGTQFAFPLDADILQHVLSNLLSNAVKYSPEGSTIYLDLVTQANQVMIQVRDEGIGIPPEDQAHLFEAFHRAANVGPVPGTGLGLAIVKQMVERHGGSITFESLVGIGTTFTVVIPVNLPPELEHANHPGH
ncbi:MAG: PAS domain S-box protein [Anaerolineae bacterium]|nr:PAS domain S-box protein [Anaerolineae bacterium]